MHGRGHPLRHRRRALRRLLLPLSGRRRRTSTTRRTFAQYGAGFPTRRTGGATTSTCWSRRWRAIKAAKPWVKFGVSPFGIWRNQATDPLGSRHQPACRPTTDLYADTRRWVKEELDRLHRPQIYWYTSLAVADYDVLVAWWVDVVAGTDVQLYIGQAAYRSARPGSRPSGTTGRRSSATTCSSTATPRGGRQHLLQRQGRPRRPARRHGHRRARLVQPPRAGAADAVDRRVGPKAPKDLSALVGGRGRPRWRAGDSTTVSYAVYRIPVTDKRVKRRRLRRGRRHEPRRDDARSVRVPDVDRYERRRSAVHVRHHRSGPDCGTSRSPAGHPR